MAETLTAVVQDEYPPRVLITASALEDTAYSLARSVGGQRTLIRGAEDIDVYPVTVFVAVDGELPFGIPVTYQLLIGGEVVASATPLTVTLPGGKLVLSDAISGLAVECVLFAQDAETSTSESTVYVIDGVNRVVSTPISGPSTALEYYTETLVARDQLRTLLEQATSGIYQQRGPSPTYDADAYYSVLTSEERRFSQDGTDPRRITTVRAAEVDGWGYGQENRGYTYQDVADVYTGLAYADLAADYATYLAVAEGDFG